MCRCVLIRKGWTHGFFTRFNPIVGMFVFLELYQSYLESGRGSGFLGHLLNQFWGSKITGEFEGLTKQAPDPDTNSKCAPKNWFGWSRLHPFLCRAGRRIRRPIFRSEVAVRSSECKWWNFKKEMLSVFWLPSLGGGKWCPNFDWLQVHVFR